jgi:phosphate transport system substrate-binding protein
MKKFIGGLLTIVISLFGAFSYAQEQTIQIDGSSTVYPITEAVAEEFQGDNPDVKVTVGISGTGGGFKRFVVGELDISDASRPIDPAEADMAKKNGIEFIELPVAYDGLAVVVNPKNNWVTSMTAEELKKLWEPAAQGKITKWNQIRSEWPDKEIHLFGPGVDSGTYEYFTEAIVKQKKASRGDFTASEDDNVLVQGVASDESALGFFGVAYYEQNKDRLKLVSIDDQNDANGKGPQFPTYENVLNGVYQPLARPLFIYVSKKSMEKPEVKKFVEFYLENGADLSKEVGYIALPEQAYELASQRFQKGVTGSVFQGIQAGVKIEDLLKKEQ